jgi:antitoxin (DNA-binding transcriptional repressor) of toxin-antitoxin stability system
MEVDMAMLHVGVRELRHYLDIARAGQAVAITDHGRVIAQLVPAEAGLKGRLEALQAAGMIRWRGNRLSPLKPVAQLRGNVTVADLVSEMRQ